MTNLNSPAVTLAGGSVATAKKRSAEIKRQLPRTVASAKQRITRLLHNPDRRGEFRNRRKGKLDRGRLARLSTGNDNVFTQPWQRQGYKTAVSLILDNSVSMTGVNNRTAVKLGYVFGDALAAANINFSVAAFPNVSISRNRKSEREDNNLTGGDRVRGSDYWGAVAGVCDPDVAPKHDNPNWRAIINEQHLNDNRHAGADTLKPFGVPWSGPTSTCHSCGTPPPATHRWLRLSCNRCSKCASCPKEEGDLRRQTVAQIGHGLPQGCSQAGQSVGHQGGRSGYWKTYM